MNKYIDIDKLKKQPTKQQAKADVHLHLQLLFKRVVGEAGTLVFNIVNI